MADAFVGRDSTLDSVNFIRGHAGGTVPAVYARFPPIAVIRRTSTKAQLVHYQTATLKVPLLAVNYRKWPCMCAHGRRGSRFESSHSDQQIMYLAFVVVGSNSPRYASAATSVLAFLILAP